MPTFDSQVKFQKIPVVELVVQQAATPGPTSPIVGQLWWDTTNGQLKVCTNATGPVWTQCDNVTGGTASNVADGDKGMITITSGVWNIDNTVITPAMLANSDFGAFTVASGVATLDSGAVDLSTAVATGLLPIQKGGTGNGSAYVQGGAVYAENSGKLNSNNTGTVGQLLRSGGTGIPTWGYPRLDELVAPTAAVSMGSQRLTNIAVSQSATDAVARSELDSVSAGLDVKPSVKAATLIDIGLSNAQTIDGIALVAGDRCLVKNQAVPANNGIYTVASGSWTRATDMDAWTEVPGAFVFIEQGTQGDTGWVCTSDQGGTLGSTAITWTQFTGVGSFVAGNGLSQTGNALNVGGTSGRISVGTDTVDIDSAYVGQASITTVGTIGTGTWNAGIISTAKGGLGQDITTAGGQANGRANLGCLGSYATNSPAMPSPGTWYTITHNLQTRARNVTFEEVSSGEGRFLDWRVNSGNPNTQIDIRHDITGGRAISYYNVNVAA